MKSDIQFNVLLNKVPMLRQSILGVDSNLPYRFTSQAFKDLQFTADGIMDCDQAHIAYIVEFQAFKEKGPRTVYHRGVIEQVLYQIEHPEKEVHLIIIYVSRSLDAAVKPWCDYARSLENRYFQVHYLVSIQKRNHFLSTIILPN